jgi:hypothetical protein
VLYNLGDVGGTERDAKDGIVSYYRQDAAQKYERLAAHHSAR